MNLVIKINLLKLIVVLFGLIAFLAISANKSYAQTAPTVQSLTPTTFSSGTTHSVNIPAVNAGDLLLAIIVNDGSATVTVPSGWTELFTFVQSAPRTGAYYMFAPSNASATTVNFQTSSTEAMAAQVYRITGAGDVAVGSPVNATGTNQPDPPNLSPGWGTVPTVWIALATQDNASNTVSSYPANYSNGTRTVGGSSTTGAMLVSARRTTTASSENPGTFVMSGSSGSMAQTIAIVGEVFPKVQSVTPSTFSNGTTHNVSMPSTVDSGDILLALVNSDGTATVTTPSGWTQLFTQTVSTTRTGAYYKIAAGNEDSTTVNFQTSSTEAMAALVYRITNGSAVEAGTATTSTSTANPPSLSPSWGSNTNLWIAMNGAQNGSRAISSYPSGYTNGQQVGISTTAGANIAAAQRNYTSSSEDPGAFTWNGTTSGSVANTLAIKPGSPTSITTTGNSGYSYNYFYGAGTLNNQSGGTLTYGVRWGAGSGYSGTSCQDLPNSQEYSTAANGFNGSIVGYAGSGITPSTLYYFCLYARNSGSTQYWYSPSTSSLTTTAPPAPTMDTMAKGEITSTTANITANINNDYGLSITAKGVCYSSTNTSPHVGQGGTTCTTNGTGSGAFTANLTSLSADTLYYYRSYATSSSGTGYSSAYQFTTEPTNPPEGYAQIISTTGFYDRNNSTTHNVPMPATVDEGDLLLALISSDGSATVTTPSGWTALYSTANSTNLRSSVFYKFANGTEDGTTVNFQTSASESMAAQVYRIKDALDVTAGTAVASSGTSPNPPSLSAGWEENVLWIPFLTLEQASQPSVYPSNYTHPRGDSDTYSSGTAWQGAFSLRRYLAASTEDPSAFTTPNVNWVVNTIAVRPKPTTPLVTTNSATSVTQTTATINATANPNGFASVGWFRYYTSDPWACLDSGGTRVPSSSGTSLGSGTTGVDYNRPLTGLSPNTTYYICAFASNTHGTGAGSPVSFTTLTGAPSGVSAEGDTNLGSYYVTLNAEGNPNGFASYGFFRLYSSNPGSCTDEGGTRYPSSDDLDDISLGSSASSQQFNNQIREGLTPQTTYYYCAFVRNAHGTVGSSVDSFTTPDGPIGPCDPPASGNHTVNGSCSYTGEVGGVDGGTGTNNTAVLTVAQDNRLTLNAGQQVAWGGISLQSGSGINLGSGGSLRRAPLWVVDVDGDGYISSTEQEIGPQPEGGVRRNALSSSYNYFSKILALDESDIDCNDNNAYAYRNVDSLVIDQDNDGYKTSAAATTRCVGDSTVINGRTYYRSGL